MIQLNQKQIRIGALVLSVMIVMIGYYFYTVLQDTKEENIQISEENIVEKPDTNEELENQIIVHIAGQVKNPGVIKTKEGARIADIIRRSRRTKQRGRYY